MELRPLTTPDIETVAAWLEQEENSKWLAFGPCKRAPGAASLKIMMQRNKHVFRMFTSDTDDQSIGVTALSDINHDFRTATLWYVLGDKRYAGQGYTSQAVARILRYGFGELGLHAVQAWTVEENRPSVRVLERNGFRFIGRLRECHRIDGRTCDRLLYDVLAADLDGLPASRMSSNETRS